MKIEIPIRHLFLDFAFGVLAGIAFSSAHLSSAADLGNRGWNDRTSPTSQGMALLFHGGDVDFYDGTSIFPIHDHDSLGGADGSTTFGLGSGAVPGEVMGAWRGGGNFEKGWVFTRKPDGSTRVVEVKYENPHKFANPDMPQEDMNPEGLAIADGHVFMVLQAFVKGNALKMAYKIDPVTGDATRLSSTNALSGENIVRGAVRVSSSGDKAVWPYEIDNTPMLVQFFNGTSVRDIDSDATSIPHLAKGQVVYGKQTNGVSQIFLYDSTGADAGPVQLTFDSSGQRGFARTDGRHVAWLEWEGVFPDPKMNVVVKLLGGLRLNVEPGAMAAAPFEDNSLQLQRGQLLWPDTNGALRYFAGNRLTTIAGSGGWLADGWIVYRANNSALIVPGLEPNDSVEPVPPILLRATPSTAQVTLEWDRVLRVTSYNIYLAAAPGVTKANYLSLPGGRKITEATSPLVLNDLNSRTNYFVVTSVEDGVEGPESGEAAAAPIEPVPPALIRAIPGNAQVTLDWDLVSDVSSFTLYVAEGSGVTKENYASLPGGRRIVNASSPFVLSGLDFKSYYFIVTSVAFGIEGPASNEGTATPLPRNTTWLSAGGFGGISFNALAADPINGAIAYASGEDSSAGQLNTYKTVDGGITWTELGGGIQSVDVRALAVNGQTVFAAAKESNDPQTFERLRNGRILRSRDGGASWQEVVPDGGFVGELQKSLAIAPLDPNTVYAGDFRLPDFDFTQGMVIKSVDGGDTWFHLAPAPPDSGGDLRAYVVAADPQTAGTVYAGGTGVPLVKSTDGGTNWTDIRPLEFGSVYAFAIDLQSSSTLYAGINRFDVEQGGLVGNLLKSVDGGASWTNKVAGLPQPAPSINALFALANPHVLFVGTGAGVFYSLDDAETWSPLNNGLPDASRWINLLTVTVSRHLVAATSDGLYSLDLSDAPIFDLGVSQSVTPFFATAGDVLSYTITVSKSSPQPAAGVLVTNLLHPTVTFVSATQSEGTNTVSGRAVIFNLGTMTNSDATLQVRARTTRSGQITNLVSLTSNEAETNRLNNTSALITTVQQSLIVEVTNPPFLSVFTAPANILIEARATDAAATVTQLVLRAGATVLASTDGPSLQFVWKKALPPGHVLEAVAKNSFGESATSTIGIVVNNPKGFGDPARAQDNYTRFLSCKDCHGPDPRDTSVVIPGWEIYPPNAFVLNGASTTRLQRVASGENYDGGPNHRVDYDLTIDNDADGMADAWEFNRVNRGLNPNNPGDAQADRNGDGQSNLDEFREYISGPHFQAFNYFANFSEATFTDFAAWFGVLDTNRYTAGGRITGNTGQPLANMLVLFTNNYSEGRVAITDAQGRYSVTNLLAGDYDVTPVLDSVGFLLPPVHVMTRTPTLYYTNYPAPPASILYFTNYFENQPLPPASPAPASVFTNLDFLIVSEPPRLGDTNEGRLLFDSLSTRCSGCHPGNLAQNPNHILRGASKIELKAINEGTKGHGGGSNFLPKVEATYNNFAAYLASLIAERYEFGGRITNAPPNGTGRAEVVVAITSEYNPGRVSVTDSNGYYLLTNLLAGDYVIRPQVISPTVTSPTVINLTRVMNYPHPLNALPGIAPNPPYAQFTNINFRIFEIQGLEPGTRPSLTVQMTGPNQLSLFWPAAVEGFFLEHTLVLSASSEWPIVTNTIERINDSNFVTFPISAEHQQFFRLRKP